MAHESHFSQFVLGIDPLVQGLEHNHEFLGIKSGMGMLEIPSKNQSSHFPKDFVYRDLPVSSSKNFLVSTDAIGVLESLHHSGSGVRLQQQQLFMQQTRDLTLQPLFHLKNSEYLKPAQELLSEFCNLGGDRSSYERPNKASHSEREPSASSSWEQSLYSMNHFELQQLKIKLFSMLEKVDKRYRKHCEKMKAVVSSFESMAGEGAANVYLTLASKVISKHFRSLKDGIVGRINTVKKAMGEKDRLIAQGATRGETPRLKLLDQCIRQQKELQQGMAQHLPWRPQRGLPEHAVSILRAWLFEHFLHPYPSDVDKIVLARQTGLSRSQVSNWFINARVRIWKPMVEDMYLEEMKELDLQPNHPTTGHQHSNNQNPNPNSIGSLDLKTLPVQLLNVDSESLSSIINSSHHDDQSHTPSSKTWLHGSQHHQQTSRTENFGVVDFDFSYGSFASDNLRSGVSLTLGLQQHNKRGMSSSFSPASPQSLIFGGEHIGYGQQVGLSIADGEAQALPCRNLLGIQMLHDLTG